MKRLKLPSLWAAFAAFVFVINLISAMLILIVTYMMLHLGLISSTGKSPAVPIIMLLLISIAIASAFSFLVGKQVLKPISNFSQAMTDVAKGDFSVTLNYGGRVEELSEMSSNFNAMVHDLGTIETLRNDFVVTVSHEFKTPLASIEGYATILQNPELTAEESKEYKDKIIESTKQLSKLSSNILMISNLENREIVTEKTAFRLDEQIRQAALLLEPYWESKKINLNVDLDHAVFYGNEELLQQVWQNVITNAIKFTPKNGDISIWLKENTDHIAVTIADTGIGMTPEVQEHIFNKFYQADVSGYTDGNGLGLSLVKRIIDLSHGKILTQSEPGLGTTFLIKLPIEKDPHRTA
jgi:signal transduction histidine kinase